MDRVNQKLHQFWLVGSSLSLSKNNCESQGKGKSQPHPFAR